MKAIPFTLATQNIKYSEVNLSKKGRDFYNENYKILKNRIERNRKRRKDPRVH